MLLRLQEPQQPRNPSDAPVSYPFLWNTHQQNKVQWNGIAPNTPLTPELDIGALGRNVGEVTGVFADLTYKGFGPAVNGYATSAQVKNLVALERQLALLKPPAWPTAFPPIDAEKWEKGKALFARGTDSCSACHQPLRRDDLATKINVEMTRLSGARAIGTDPWMACNAYTYEARTGVLRGTPSKFFLIPPSPLLGRTAPVSELLGTTVLGSIWYRGNELVGNIREALKSGSFFDLRKLVGTASAGVTEVAPSQDGALDESKAARLGRCMAESSEVLAYKGRPLGGVWATAPYLHNGSVPSLFDLLLPPDQRPVSFVVGTREFDPERVGYVTERTSRIHQSDRASRENTFVFRTRDASGNPIPGNSNAGHDYGNASLSDDDRWALVEYMKAAGGHREGNRIVP